MTEEEKTLVFVAGYCAGRLVFHKESPWPAQISIGGRDRKAIRLIRDCIDAYVGSPQGKLETSIAVQENGNSYIQLNGRRSVAFLSLIYPYLIRFSVGNKIHKIMEENNALLEKI